MLTSYSRPLASAITSVTVVGTGAAILTPTADLFNGRPADATRLRWLSKTPTAVTDVVKIQIVWNSGAFVPSIVGLIGLDLIGLASSAGLKFSFLGQRVTDGSTFPYALGGNTDLVRSVTRSDGSTCVLAACATSGLTAIRGLEMTIWNDVGGAVALTPSQFLDLGDFWVGPGGDINIDADWKLTFPETASDRTSPNNQPWPELYPPGRMLTVNATNLSFNDTFIDGALPSFQSLRTILGNDRPSIQVPRWTSAVGGALDVPSLHATAIFGLSKFSEITRDQGDIFAIHWTHKETPALMA